MSNPANLLMIGAAEVETDDEKEGRVERFRRGADRGPDGDVNLGESCEDRNRRLRQLPYQVDSSLATGNPRNLLVSGVLLWGKC